MSSNYLYQAAQSARGGGDVQPVEHFHLYKALREEELRAIRSLVRVFAMHGPNGSNGLSQKFQERLLQDLGEALDITPQAISAERSLAASDPAVQLVRNANVSHLTHMHRDALNDIPLGAWLSTDVEDDGATMLSRATGPQHSKLSSAGVFPGSNNSAVGSSQQSGAVRPPNGLRGASKQQAAAALSKYEKMMPEAVRLQKEVTKLSIEYSRLPEGDVRRIQIRNTLEEKRALVLSMLKVAEKEDNEESALESGSATPQ